FPGQLRIYSFSTHQKGTQLVDFNLPLQKSSSGKWEGLVSTPGEYFMRTEGELETHRVEKSPETYEVKDWSVTVSPIWGVGDLNNQWALAAPLPPLQTLIG